MAGAVDLELLNEIQDNDQAEVLENLPDGVDKSGRAFPEPFKPSVKACSKAGCGDLVKVFAFGRYQKRCRIIDRIPGNMSVCPKDNAASQGVR